MSLAKHSPVSPARKKDQDAVFEANLARGRRPLPMSGIFTQHEIHMQNVPRSSVRVNSQRCECPIGFTTEFNNGASNIPRWEVYQEEYHPARDEPLNTTPPPPPLPHFHLPPQHYSSSFREEFGTSGAYTDPTHGDEGMRLSSMPDRNVRGETHYTYKASNVAKDTSNQPLQYNYIPHYSSGSHIRSFSESRQVPKGEPESLQPNADHNPQRLSPLSTQRSGNLRPASSHSAFSDMGPRGRPLPGLGYIPPPSPGLRVSSTHSRHSSDNRPTSQLSASYSQSTAVPISLGESNLALRTAVGTNATLLSAPKTLEMYRKNVFKTNDLVAQYGFAMLLIEAAQEAEAPRTQSSSCESLPKKIEGNGKELSGYLENQTSASELLDQARQILKNLSDRSYPLAQYYLADGYASGFFAKGKQDHEKAFPLFVAASKRGHAESGYRAALCYEYGWGCKKDLAKAFQFHRQSASKNHPGAMTRLGKACIWGGLGPAKHREGLKWLKRAQETADIQYNAAPYHLGCLYEEGFGADIFKDEAYAARLFTQAADLGHVEAAYRLGDAYEHGKLSCPRDAALSVHFYTQAAQQNHLDAMMGLCAWYVVGADPVLAIDYEEAFEWALKAAKHEYPAAEYAVACFNEMGMGCRRDPLEANVWFTRAADHGEPRAKVRLEAIKGAATGEGVARMKKKKKKKNGTTLTPATSSSRLNSIDPNSRSNSSTQASAKKKDSSTPKPKSKQSPAVTDQDSSTESDTPQVVSSKGHRFSLGESPQRPKRGVLRKQKVQRSDDDEDGMAAVSNVGDMLRDKEKKEKGSGWFSGLWN